jgi:transposase
MPVAPAPALILTRRQRQQLEAIVRKRTHPQRLVERARIILKSGDGLPILKIAHQLELALNTVRKWRRRWESMPDAEIAQRLADLPRPGAPARITPEEICRILALACEPPSSCNRPITHWTQQELADEAMRQGIVGSVSQRSVGRFLKSGRS